LFCENFQNTQKSIKNTKKWSKFQAQISRLNVSEKSLFFGFFRKKCSWSQFFRNQNFCEKSGKIAAKNFKKSTRDLSYLPGECEKIPKNHYFPKNHFFWDFLGIFRKAFFYSKNFFGIFGFSEKWSKIGQKSQKHKKSTKNRREI